MQITRYGAQTLASSCWSVHRACLGQARTGHFQKVFRMVETIAADKVVAAILNVMNYTTSHAKCDECFLCLNLTCHDETKGCEECKPLRQAVSYLCSPPRYRANQIRG